MKKIKRGKELPQTKLSEEEVRAIRFVVEEEGMPIPDAARTWGISRQHCWRIVTRKAR